MSDQEKEIKVENNGESVFKRAFRKQVQNTESFNEEKLRFEIDLRVQGVLEDVIIKDSKNK